MHGGVTDMIWSCFTVASMDLGSVHQLVVILCLISSSSPSVMWKGQLCHGVA